MQLRRFSTTLYKDKNASDNAQVPASDATFELFYQGATVVDDTAIGASPGYATVTVYSIGALAVGDLVAVGATDSPTFNVDAINSATEILLSNNSANLVILAANSRLRILNRQPNAFLDNAGTVTVTPAPTANGLVEFYTKERFFDYRVSGPGFTTALFQEGYSGYVTDPPYFDVRSFSSVQVALDTLPIGARLYFPAVGGPYMPPSAAGWIISKPIEIFGDSDSLGLEGTEFVFWNNGSPPNGSKNSTVFTITNDGSYSYGHRVYLHDFTISTIGGNYPTDTDGTGDGIRLDQTARELIDIRIERVSIDYAGRSGIRAMNGSSNILDEAPFYCINLQLKEILVYQPKGIGVLLAKTTGPKLDFVTVNQGYRSGIIMVNSSNSPLIKVEIGGCGQGNTDTNLEGFMVLYECGDMNITGSNIEGFAYYDDGVDPYHALTVKNGLVLVNCRACSIEANEFDNAQVSTTSGSRGIYLYSAGSTNPNDGVTVGNRIGVNFFADVDKAILVQNSAAVYGNVIMPQTVRTANATNSPCTVDDAGGRNWVFVTDKPTHSRIPVGIRFPKVADVASIDASVVTEGLVVYDSTAGKFKGYATSGGTGWKDLH